MRHPTPSSRHRSTIVRGVPGFLAPTGIAARGRALALAFPFGAHTPAAAEVAAVLTDVAALGVLAADGGALRDLIDPPPRSSQPCLLSRSGLSYLQEQL